LDKAERDVALANREESLAQLRKLFEKPENWLFTEPNSSLAEALADQPEPLLAESLAPSAPPKNSSDSSDSSANLF
jgi:hypothetical protein